jgi:diadenosine tetraphosphate (Ap4A) HIT family hydrolase
MAAFEIHPQLLADCHRLGKLPFCHVLLHKNGIVPWFMLVPQCDVTSLLDLAETLRGAAMKEAAGVSEFVKKTLGWPKINFAAIGNVVPQLHLHVVGRKPGDACWPAPVWGHLTAAREYSAAEINEIIKLLSRECDLRRG